MLRGPARSEAAAAFARQALDRWRLGSRADVVEAARRMAASAPGDAVDLRLQASPDTIRVEMICRAGADRSREVVRQVGSESARAGVTPIGRASCAWIELDR